MKDRRALIDIAALCVRDARLQRANAVAALERFAEGRGQIRHAAHNIHLARETHRKAVRALEAVANYKD